MTTFSSMAAPLRALVILGAMSAGCASVENITVRVPEKIVVDPSAANVVIIQPASDLRSVVIIDGHGHLAGQLDKRSHTLVRLPEGPTILYAVLDGDPATADRLEGTLLAGRVYYAKIAPRPGGVSLLSLSPRSPDWSHKDEYLSSTTRVQMDPQKAQRAVDKMGVPLPVMDAADTYVANLDAARRAEHEIAETDGL